jgi:hypothetical protein
MPTARAGKRTRADTPVPHLDPPPPLCRHMTAERTCCPGCTREWDKTETAAEIARWSAGPRGRRAALQPASIHAALFARWDDIRCGGLRVH